MLNIKELIKDVSVIKEPQFNLEYYAENLTKFVQKDRPEQTTDQNKTNGERDIVEILTT